MRFTRPGARHHRSGPLPAPDAAASACPRAGPARDSRYDPRLRGRTDAGSRMVEEWWAWVESNVPGSSGRPRGGSFATTRTWPPSPCFGAIASIVILAVFVGLIFATGLNDGGSGSNESIRPIGWVFVVCLYIGLAFVAVYFQAALTYGANERLQGRDTGIRASLDAANGKLHRLLPWALVAATVSIIIRSLEDRGIVGQIVGAPPRHRVGARHVPDDPDHHAGGPRAREGAQALRPALQADVGRERRRAVRVRHLRRDRRDPGDHRRGGRRRARTCFPLTIAVGAVAVAWLAVVSIVISAMTGIYKVALYHYAVDGTAPAAFADSNLETAFQPRQRRALGGGGFGGFGGGTGTGTAAASPAPAITSPPQVAVRRTRGGPPRRSVRARRGRTAPATRR